MRKRGFTLIELSIVVVIIGLIIGGALVGRDMIEMAQARSLMSQMEKYQLALTTFKLKYACLPGDCKMASELGLGPSGNGDKYIGNTAPAGGYYSCLGDSSTTRCYTETPYEDGIAAYQITRTAGELQWYWMHLGNAELIAGRFQELDRNNVDITEDLPLYFPRDVNGNEYIVGFSWNGRFYLRTGMNDTHTTYSSPVFQRARLSSAQMAYIATKHSLPPINLNVDTGYPAALAAGQRILPLGVDAVAASGRWVYLSPSVNSPPTEFGKCVISDGFGGYKYNIEGGGSCNLMWELDY